MLTGNLTGTTISATNVSASTFAGSGENIFNLDYNKILYNKPNLNLYALKSYVDGSYSTTGNDPNYLKLSGGILRNLTNFFRKTYHLRPNIWKFSE